MRVKVCGMTQIEQVEQLPGLGATFAGFIFYPKSPRYVFRHLTTTDLRRQNNINKVGVFGDWYVDSFMLSVFENVKCKM